MHGMAETETVPSYVLCLFERSPLRTNFAFLLIYPTYKFTPFFFFLVLISPLVPCSSDSCAQATAGTPRLPLGFPRVQVALLCLHRPHAQEGFKKEKERHLAPRRCWANDGSTVGQPAKQTHAMLPSVVQRWQLWSNPLRNWRLLAWDLLLVCFFFFNSLTAELYQVIQAKYGKAWKPWRHYLFIFTNPAISQFSCFEFVL